MLNFFKKCPENAKTKAPVPTFSCFTLCDECMLHCRMCQKWKPDLHITPGHKRMGLEEWKQCAVSLRKITPENFIINFGGGEVTAVPWLFELVSFCHSLKFKTNIATNAFLVDREKAEQMAASGLDSVSISLDSREEAVHDNLRGVPGVYRKVMNAIELISRHAERTQISICSVIMAPTLEGIIDLVQWVQDNDKIDMIYLMVLMQPNNTEPQAQWWRDERFNALWPKDYKKAAAVLDELIALKRKGYKICNPVEHIQAFKPYFHDPATYVKESACNIDHAIHISAVGDMFMCYQQESLGNVRQKSVETMWRGEHAARVRARINECRENCHFLLNCKFEV